MAFITNQYITKQNIRNKIRNIRKFVTKKEQYQTAQKIAHYIINQDKIKQSKNIGLFHSSDEEIQTNILIQRLLSLGKKIYLPILNPFEKSKTLLFSQYTLSTCLIPNKFKIYEPKLIQKSLIISIEQLEILFIPLIAFDNYGNRLGMGGGFYDRTLNSWNNNFQKYLIGLAYDFQKVNDTLPIERWDIPLPEIITPSTHWIWKNTKLTTKSI